MQLFKVLSLLIGVLLSVSVLAIECPVDKPLRWQGKCYTCEEEKTLENHYPQDGYISAINDVCEEVCSNRIFYGFSWLGEGDLFCAKDTIVNRLDAAIFYNISNMWMILAPQMWILYFFCGRWIYRLLYRFFIAVKSKWIRNLLSVFGLLSLLLFLAYFKKGDYLVGGFLIIGFTIGLFRKIFMKNPENKKEKKGISKVSKIIRWILVVALLGLLLYNFIQYIFIIE